MTKRAVVVGINDYSALDPTTDSDLSSCVADATAMYHLLVDGFGFTRENVYYYADSAATRATILRALAYITEQATPGDVAVLYYSGHGARVRADSARADDEVYYEALVPASGDFLTDWDLVRTAQTLAPETCNLTVLIDACHSGGLLDLPSDSQAKVRSLPYSQELIDLICAHLGTLIPFGICLPAAAHGELTGNVSGLRDRGDGSIDLDEDPDRTLLASARATLLSACRADELSWETSGLGHGLLTQAFLDTFNVSRADPLDYREAHQALAARVDELLTTHIRPGHPGVTQVPQLRGQLTRMGEEFLEGWTSTPA